MSTPSHHLRSLRAVLAVVVIVGVSVLFGASVPAQAGDVADRPGADRALLADALHTGTVAAARSVGASVAGAGSLDPAGARDIRLVARPDRIAARSMAADWIARVTPDVPESAARSIPKGSATSTATSTAASVAYQGRNHVWIPALGIDRSVAGFACSSSFYPGDRVYRWGCAGARNVYLFGHAHSVFKPLHDAYVRGRLAKDMRVIYADGDGRTGTYAVSWWKVTTPDDGVWAYAAQSTPSLTLQTCVGAQSQFRLIVRLTKVD